MYRERERERERETGQSVKVLPACSDLHQVNPCPAHSQTVAGSQLSLLERLRYLHQFLCSLPDNGEVFLFPAKTNVGVELKHLCIPTAWLLASRTILKSKTCK
ncbi:hypothetical protein XENTR_v10014863 [Xenopus tropicalis]|nr:hypothetical protein XENTR_v10014863 [Xenopus tropicalis]